MQLMLALCLQPAAKTTLKLELVALTACLDGEKTRGQSRKAKPTPEISREQHVHIEPSVYSLL